MGSDTRGGSNPRTGHRRPWSNIAVSEEDVVGGVGRRLPEEKLQVTVVRYPGPEVPRRGKPPLKLTYEVNYVGGREGGCASDRNSRTPPSTYYAIWPRADSVKVQLTRRDEPIQAIAAPQFGGTWPTRTLESMSCGHSPGSPPATDNRSMRCPYNRQPSPKPSTEQPGGHGGEWCSSPGPLCSDGGVVAVASVHEGLAGQGEELGPD